MAKESKHERIVRQIFDNVTEHLHELKMIETNLNNKESDVERWVQMFMKTCLGYSATNGYTIRAQEQKGKHRPDLVIYSGETPTCVIEVKKLGFDLSKSDFRCGKVQLQEYLFSLGKVPYGILCNGYEFKLYDFGNNTGIIEVLSMDLRNEEDKIDCSKKYVDDLCYDLIDLHETTYRNKEWQDFAKEATAFSPESLTKAILSSGVVKLISKEIRGEHEYKANLEVLFDKIYDLIANGLDDSLKDFNDIKKAEFQKYIKSQVKQCRKMKKAQKTNNDPQVVTQEKAIVAIDESPEIKSSGSEAA